MDNKKFKSLLRNMLKVYNYIKAELIDGLLLKRFIKEKSPPIVHVCVAMFRQEMYGEWRGHFVVISGYEKSYFIVNDPASREKLRVRNDVLISFYLWRGIYSIISGDKMRLSFISKYLKFIQTH